MEPTTLILTPTLPSWNSVLSLYISSKIAAALVNHVVPIPLSRVATLKLALVLSSPPPSRRPKHPVKDVISKAVKDNPNNKFFFIQFAPLFFFFS